MRVGTNGGPAEGGRPATMSVMSAIDRVALSGGCMLNARIVGQLVPALESSGTAVYRHREVSPGDGGVALGQVEVARQRLAAGTF